MYKKKVIQMITAVAILAAGLGSIHYTLPVSVRAQEGSMSSKTQAGDEEVSLTVWQEGSTNELELELAVSKMFQKNIASFEITLTFDSDTVKEVNTKWNSNLKDAQCLSVYQPKTGVLKLYVVGKKDLVKNGKIAVGSIIVKNSQKSETISALTMDGVQIVDLNHVRHELTMIREPQYFTCYPEVSSTEPSVKPNTPSVKPPVPTVVTPTVTPKPSIVKVEKITLNKTKVSLEEGKRAELTAKVLPTHASKPLVRWKTSNAKIASVSTNGVVKGIKKGTAVITACSVDGSEVYAQAVITVKEVKVKKVVLSMKKAELLPQETKQLTAKIEPSNTSNKKLVYRSSKPSVVSVSKTGKITAKKPGTATITVTSAENSRISASCKVTVSELIVKNPKVEVAKGKKVQIQTRTAKKGTKVTYRCADTKVAVVSKSGKITAKRKGTTTISVKAGKITKKVTVVVK